MCIFETDSSCCPAAYRKRHDCSEVRLQVFLQKTANVSKKGSTTHHTSTFQPGSFTHRIRHTLEVWFNQLPFTSCPVHASGLFDCIPLLECNGTRTQGVDHRLEVMQNWCRPAVCSLYHSVCLSLLQCMTAPCRHSPHTTRCQRGLLLQTCFSIISHTTQVFPKGVTTAVMHKATPTRTLQVDMGRCHMSGVVPSPVISRLSVVAWPQHSLVHPDPWTCLKVTLQSSRLLLAGRRGGRV